MGIYIVAKFGTDWSIFANASLQYLQMLEYKQSQIWQFFNSRADNSEFLSN